MGLLLMPLLMASITFSQSKDKIMKKRWSLP
jgi:hypothetical protein